MSEKHVRTFCAIAAVLCLVVPATLASDQVMTATGKAVKVDVEQRVLTIQADGGKSISFEVDGETTVLRGPLKLKFADIAVGDTVTVNYKKKNDTLIAVTIGVQRQA
jgi:Cu/Ag efflux protein CusF